MLYDTHKRYGQVAGLVSLPLASNVGLLNTEIFGTGMMNGTVGMVALCGVGILGAMFGAEFPDLDSPTSKPSQKHKILSGIFKACGVKHRGKFSHDILVQTLFWALIFFLVAMVGSSVSFIGSEMVFNVALVYVAFVYVGVLSHLFADALTVDGVWFAGLFKVRLMPVFLRKVGVGRWKPFRKAFTTASGWNDMNFKLMTFVIPFAAMYALSCLFVVA